ncbi:hypothetical protein TELCIR_01156 [Teladorsagia circumcincta]|uniref:Uncharacterized protein n=1 Tax=Teladorsagia circumcincta TaxID=45464 RepID=A0A2G9V2N6_TELCI|nr:hypothetical protein TELCIR_01156 [Teladorsagia circumcincta]
MLAKKTPIRTPRKPPKTKRDVKKTTKVNIYPESEFPEKVGDLPKTEIIEHKKFTTSDKHKQQLPEKSQRTRTIQKARESIEKSRQQMKQLDEERRASKKSGKSPAPSSKAKGVGESAGVPSQRSSNRTPLASSKSQRPISHEPAKTLPPWDQLSGELSEASSAKKPTVASVCGKPPSDRSTGKAVTASTDTEKGSTSSDRKFVYSPPRGKPVIRVVKKSSRARHRRVEKDPDLKTARESESYLELANRWAIRQSRDSIKESRQIMKKHDEVKRQSKEFAVNPAYAHTAMLKQKEDDLELLRMPPPPLSTTATSSTTRPPRPLPGESSFFSSTDCRSLGTNYHRAHGNCYCSCMKFMPKDGGRAGQQVSQGSGKKKRVGLLRWLSSHQVVLHSNQPFVANLPTNGSACGTKSGSKRSSKKTKKESPFDLTSAGHSEGTTTPVDSRLFTATTSESKPRSKTPQKPQSETPQKPQSKTPQKRKPDVKFLLKDV